MMRDSFHTPGNTPLWPAGHLPLKGGDRPAVSALPNVAAQKRVRGFATLMMAGDGRSLPISPLEGEMAGRPEGGSPSLRRQTHFPTFIQEAIHAPRF
ncbi:hypothetical protein M2360_004859 [Rhizobium sp. SG_E_25_P2]|nr:hypothetical protein [Rhizobium sp. SG_E_25_P2]